MIDLGHALAAGDPVWPGDPPIEVTPLASSPFRLSRLSFGEHAGTHLGAPSHYGFVPTMDGFTPELAARQGLFHLENVAQVPPGLPDSMSYLLAPLKVTGASGAPTRLFVW